MAATPDFRLNTVEDRIMPKAIIKAIDTEELCSYGCDQRAKYINASNKLMCDVSSNKCPANRQKNSEKGKQVYASGRRPPSATAYALMTDDSKTRMNWAKGLTKEIDPRVARPQFIGRRFGASLNGHSDETKQKLAVLRTEYLKKSENRKNLGSHKPSWMELKFAEYLNTNSIVGWQTEKHFWSSELRKSFYPDFLFEDLKLIIELDGTQHRKTVEHDALRDQWFNSIGYRVIRVSHAEFKDRLFSGRGFKDLLGS